MNLSALLLALAEAKLLKAARLQSSNFDNLSMLVTVATGQVASMNELLDLADFLRASEA